MSQVIELSMNGLNGVADNWFAARVGCNEYTQVLVQIEDALLQADADAKVDKKAPAYTRAKALIERETGMLTRTKFLFPNECNAATASSTAIRDDLLRLMKSSGVKNVLTVTNPDKPTSAGEILKVAKWGAISLTAVAVVYLIGPAVRAASSVAAGAVNKAKPSTSAAVNGYEARKRKRKARRSRR